MKIALIGYGKMGKMVEKCALENGHEIVAQINQRDWDLNLLAPADLCIEFTHPDAALENMRKAAQMQKDLVVGTTGWYDQIKMVSGLVDKANIGMLYSPNFSIGVHLLLSILEHAASLMNGFKDYDAAGMEIHHHQKKDSPSGTALQIAQAVEKNLARIDQLPFSSVRCGSFPGTHTVMFDSPCDTITITHEARSREGFARGAVQAAEWLHGKKGVYTFEQCMQSMTTGLKTRV